MCLAYTGPAGTKSPLTPQNTPRQAQSPYHGFGVLTVTAACPSCAQPYRSSSRCMLPTLQRISRSPLASAGPSVPCRSLMGVTDANPGDWGPPHQWWDTPNHRRVTRERGQRVVGMGLVAVKIWWIQRFADIKVWWH